MQAVCAVAFGEEFLDFDFEDFGEIHERAVVHEDEAGFDFGDAAAVDFHSGDLKLGGERRLRPVAGVAESADLRADVVFEGFHLAFGADFFLRSRNSRAVRLRFRRAW